MLRATACSSGPPSRTNSAVAELASAYTGSLHTPRPTNTAINFLQRQAPGTNATPATSSLQQHRFIRVPANQLDRLQNQLLAIFSTNISVRTVQNRQIFVITIGGENSSQLEVEFDRQRSGILLGGQGTTANQLVALIDSLARHAT